MLYSVVVSESGTVSDSVALSEIAFVSVASAVSDSVVSTVSVIVKESVSASDSVVISESVSISSLWQAEKQLSKTATITITAINRKYFIILCNIVSSPFLNTRIYRSHLYIQNY